MKISPYSRNRFIKTFGKWRVDKEYAEPMYNYLVYGFNPGSFFTSLLANDAMGAISRSHPANTMQALKNLVGWIRDEMPPVAYGNYDALEQWGKLSESERRAILELKGLIFTEKEETWLNVKGDPIDDPWEYAQF